MEVVKGLVAVNDVPVMLHGKYPWLLEQLRKLTLYGCYCDVNYNPFYNVRVTRPFLVGKGEGRIQCRGGWISSSELYIVIGIPS